MRLEGKSAVITGGGTGIGCAIASALASEGCRVAIAGRREAALQEVVRGWNGPGELLAHAVDVSDRQSVEQLFQWSADSLGPLDILVNNAGINVPNRSMAEGTSEDWDRILSVVATGTFNCTRAVMVPMCQRGEGLIINISSVSGKRAAALGGIAYTAAKFAQTGFGLAVGQELAAHGVRVTNIYPGEVNTPILDQRPIPVSPSHRQQILQPEDLGEAVLMIASLPPRAHVPELVIKPTFQAYG